MNETQAATRHALAVEDLELAYLVRGIPREEFDVPVSSTQLRECAGPG